MKEFHNLFVLLEYLPSAILQKFSTGGMKKPYKRKEVAWGELTIFSLPPMQRDCDGQSMLQRIADW